MSPPERFAHDDPREWMNRARSNLARARLRVPEAYLEDLCFDAQQAAEKAIKAALVLDGVEFPYVHDLRRLRNLLSNDWPREPSNVVLQRLTEWGAESRYPGDWPEIAGADSTAAAASARAVYDTITSEFARRGVAAE